MNQLFLISALCTALWGAFAWDYGLPKYYYDARLEKDLDQRPNTRRNFLDLKFSVSKHLLDGSPTTTLHSTLLNTDLKYTLDPNGPFGSMWLRFQTTKGSPYVTGCAWPNEASRKALQGVKYVKELTVLEDHFMSYSGCAGTKQSHAFNTLVIITDTQMVYAVDYVAFFFSRHFFYLDELAYYIRGEWKLNQVVYIVGDGVLPFYLQDHLMLPAHYWWILPAKVAVAWGDDFMQNLIKTFEKNFRYSLHVWRKEEDIPQGIYMTYKHIFPQPEPELLDVYKRQPILLRLFFVANDNASKAAIEIFKTFKNWPHRFASRVLHDSSIGTERVRQVRYHTVICSNVNIVHHSDKARFTYDTPDEQLYRFMREDKHRFYELFLLKCSEKLMNMYSCDIHGRGAELCVFHMFYKESPVVYENEGDIPLQVEPLVTAARKNIPINVYTDAPFPPVLNFGALHLSQSSLITEQVPWQLNYVHTEALAYNGLYLKLKRQLQSTFVRSPPSAIDIMILYPKYTASVYFHALMKYFHSMEYFDETLRAKLSGTTIRYSLARYSNIGDTFMLDSNKCNLEVSDKSSFKSVDFATKFVGSRAVPANGGWTEMYRCLRKKILPDNTQKFIFVFSETLPAEVPEAEFDQTVVDSVIKKDQVHIVLMTSSPGTLKSLFISDKIPRLTAKWNYSVAQHVRSYNFVAAEYIIKALAAQSRL